MRLICLIFMLYSGFSSALDLSKLDKKQRDELYQGKFILIAHEVKDAPWPRLEIYKIVNADALEFGAFFSDFKLQTEYVPDLLKAEPLKGKSATEIPVDYEIKLPWPLSNARYIHVHEVKLSENNEPHLSWYLQESTVAEEVKGFASFYGMGEKTLWHYEAFMRPKSALAGLFSGTMQKDTLNSLQKTEDYFFKLKNEKSKKLELSIERYKNHFKTQ